jgi:two-component system, NtrC family, sensor kinase
MSQILDTFAMLEVSTPLVSDLAPTESAAASSTTIPEFSPLWTIWHRANYGIYLLDVNQDGTVFRFVQGNPFFHQCSFIPKDTLSALTLTTEGEFSEICFHHYRECYMSRAPIMVEERIHYQGKDRWWLLNLNPVENKGQITQMIGTVTEITDRKVVVTQISEYADRQLLLNHLTKQIYSALSSDGVIQESIQAIFHLLNLDYCGVAWFCPSPETNSWKTVQEERSEGVNSALGNYPAKLFGSIETTLAQGDVIQIDDAREWPDPSLRSYLKSNGIRSRLLVPLLTQTGQLGMIACDRHQLQAWREDEITLVTAVAELLATGLNHAKAQEQLQVQTRQLEHQLKEFHRQHVRVLQTEKMSSLSQLVAGIAHEINNPINFIYGNLAPAATYAEDMMRIIAMYQESFPDPGPEIESEINRVDLLFVMTDLSRLIESMRVGADRISEIVLSLRTFSRLDESEVKPVDIHDGIDSTLMILENRLQETDESPRIRVIKNYDASLPFVECYAGKLNQVFLNIMSNSIDAIVAQYKLDPTLYPQIVIQTLQAKNKVEIRIQDNGVGIGEGALSQIFDPFFTTKPIGQGTGMGLAMSHQIVTEDHQGSLTCESEVGQGCVFIIRIPMNQ